MPLSASNQAPVHALSEPVTLYAEPLTSFERLISAQVPFLDHRGLDWPNVARTKFFAYQRFQYVYPSLVLDLSQRLMIKPRTSHNDQRLLDFKLSVEPIALAQREHRDGFGNSILELEIARINNWTSFEAMFCVERVALTHRPTWRRGEATHLLSQPTPLTSASPRLLEVARTLRAQARSPFELSERISDWVSNVMQYRSGLTGVRTTASEALEIGAGLCQDYAHIALALCRANGMSARYVSGHMLGEGGSHAWLEVLLPTEQGFEVVGFDPTNARRPNLGYTTVAVGRDYTDVPPTSGRFTGQGGGRLDFEKYSGLIEVEFVDGQVLSA